MKIKTYKAFNPDAILELDLKNHLRNAFIRTNRILNYIDKLNPEIQTDYKTAFKTRLVETTQGFSLSVSLFDLDEIAKDLPYLEPDPEIQVLILYFIGLQLGLPANTKITAEIIEVTSLGEAKANERLSYQAAKACADVLGDQQGIHLWKGVIDLMLDDDRIAYETRKKERLAQGEQLPTREEIRERGIERWIKIGLADFTMALLEDEKVLFRFDRCLTHEALKDLNDPDFAYLCSCYIGDAEGFNFPNRFQHLRRTQTLHHGAFCDELYWDPRLCTDPEQPSLDFTSKLEES